MSEVYERSPITGRLEIITTSIIETAPEDDRIFLSQLSTELDEETGEARSRILPSAAHLIFLITKAGLKPGKLTPQHKFFNFPVYRVATHIGDVLFKEIK